MAIRYIVAERDTLKKASIPVTKRRLDETLKLTKRMYPQSDIVGYVIDLQSATVRFMPNESGKIKNRIIEHLRSFNPHIKPSPYSITLTKGRL